MPAYLKPIAVVYCAEPGCNQRATVTLFNAQNSAIADYCARHDDNALARFEGWAL